MAGVSTRSPPAAEAARPLHPVSAQDYAAAMSRAVTGVTIVTTDGPAGRFGMTVSAMTSVSAEPPMLMVCINRKSPLAAAIAANGLFCVSLRGAHQADLSDRFAGRPRQGTPFSFSGADWRQTPSGAWRLDDAAASFDCDLDAVHAAGSHDLCVGRVLAAATSPHAPLAYCRRGYCIIGPPEGAELRKAS